MQTDSIERFLDNYIDKTKGYNVPTESVRWYVKHVEAYIKAHPARRLALHTHQDVDKYLQDLGKNSRLRDWQFQQVVDALKILFVDIIRPQWASSFPWDFWRDAASQLTHTHATLARDCSQSSVINADSDGNNNGTADLSISEDGLVNKARLKFPKYFSRLIIEIRVKQYSIRTKHAYESWLARYLVFHSMRDPATLDGEAVASFLEY